MAARTIGVTFQEHTKVNYSSRPAVPTTDIFDESILLVDHEPVRIKRSAEDRDPQFNAWVPKPVLRPEYGALYQHQGFLMPGLKRTYLFVAIDLPQQADLMDNPPEFPSCNEWGNRNLEYWQNTEIDIPDISELIHQQVCRDHSAAYDEMLEMIKHRRVNITYKIENVLPSLLPNAIVNSNQGKAIELPNGQLWTSEMESRTKRAIPLAAVPAIFAGVQAVGGLVIKGINAVASYKRSKAMAGAMKKLYANDQILHNRLVSIENRTAVLAKAQLTGFEIMNSRMLSIENKWQTSAQNLERLVNTTNRQFRRTHEAINNHHLAIKFASMATNQHLRILRQYTGFYDTYERTLDHFLAGLDALGTGRLTYQLLDPVDLHRFLRSIAYHFQQKERGVSLAFDHTYQYYAEPMVTFTNTAMKLLIQIPIYIKHEFQMPMSIFSTEVAPVPYDAETYNGQNSQYTLIDIEFPYIAIGPDNYIPLSETQLRLCWKLGYTYYCENSYLLRDKTQHTCASSIFYNENEHAKIEHCKPKFVQNKHFEPKVLDAGEQIVLSNLPQPWVLICGQEHRPFPIQYSTYRIINRTELCECSLSAGSYYLGPSLTNCHEMPEGTLDGIFDSYFVFNKIIFDILKDSFDILPSLNVQKKLSTLLEYVPQYEFDPLSWFQYSDTRNTILDQENSEITTELLGVLQHVVQDTPHQIYRNTMEWNLAQNDFQTFITEAEYWQRVEFISAMIGPLTLIIVVIALILHKKIVFSALLSANVFDEYEIVKTVQKVHGAPTTPRAIFTIPPIIEQHANETTEPDQKATISITAVLVTLLIVALLFSIWRRYRYVSSMARTCFPLYPLSRIVRGTARTDIFVEITDLQTSQTMWAHFARVAVHPTLLTITGNLNSSDIQIMNLCCCKVMNVDWGNILMTDNKSRVIHLPARGAVSIWTTQELKSVEPTRPYTVKILGRVLDQIMILKQSRNGPPATLRAQNVLGSDPPQYF